MSTPKTFRPIRLIQPFAILILLLVNLTRALADTEIVLNNAFIEKYRDRVTIDLDDFIVDIAHEKPNRPIKDGDLHAAGRSETVGLAMVAEIMNAALHMDAVARIHQVEGKSQPVKVSGAWRVWCEHSRKNSTHMQGGKIPKYKDANPDHVFEIHPITRIEDISLEGSLVPIKGYEPELRKKGRTSDAFHEFENKYCEIASDANRTTITTRVARYNYVEFIMELSEKPRKVEDGITVSADVYDIDDEDEEPLAEGIRMAFVKESDPEQKVKNLNKGDRMHVVGVSRISLALVHERVEQSKTKHHVLKESLPYEFVIVAVIPSQTKKDKKKDLLSNQDVETTAKLQFAHASDEFGEQVRQLVVRQEDLIRKGEQGIAKLEQANSRQEVMLSTQERLMDRIANLQAPLSRPETYSFRDFAQITLLVVLVILVTPGLYHLIRFYLFRSLPWFQWPSDERFNSEIRDRFREMEGLIRQILTKLG